MNDIVPSNNNYRYDSVLTLFYKIDDKYYFDWTYKTDDVYSKFHCYLSNKDDVYIYLSSDNLHHYSDLESYNSRKLACEDSVKYYFNYDRKKMVKAMRGYAHEKHHALDHLYPSRAAIIEKYGYGPFDRIHPLTFTGKQIDEPFQYTKKK